MAVGGVVDDADFALVEVGHAGVELGLDFRGVAAGVHAVALAEVLDEVVARAVEGMAIAFDGGGGGWECGAGGLGPGGREGGKLASGAGGELLAGGAELGVGGHLEGEIDGFSDVVAVGHGGGF